ncbi:MAG: Acetyl-CoA decarbonylase/synthase complex subunit epsilon [Methanosaeta sp. PtaB.Bin039]|nr:MAG: Acetyl-CoA decarbonylase/synthase complex subunit epsilon [Methanosaeta sp. PtaB.Bin039]
MAVDTTKNPIPFEMAQIPGPEMAKTYATKVMGAIIKKSKRPLLVVGAELFEDPVMFDKVIEMAKAKNMPIAATAHSVKGFVDRGYLENVHQIGLHPLTNYLRFADWKGLDGQGQYDAVIFMGIFYKFANAMFATLKNFNRDIKRISLDRYYHVNADMTFGNLAFDPDGYHEAIDEVIAALKK